MTETEAKQRTAYDIAADDLCAAIARNDDEYARIRFEYAITPKMMPSKWHEEFCNAVYSLRESNTAIHDVTIKERCTNAPLNWILEILTLYDKSRTGAANKESARIVRTEGLKLGTIRLLEIAKEQIVNGKSRDVVVNNLLSVLPSIGLNGSIQNVKTSDHAQKNRDERNRQTSEKDNPLTGMAWWDMANIRYEPSQIWWIAGAYKSRKTTLAMNMALSAALRGYSIGFLSKEMSQARVQSIFEAMLAVGYLARHGLKGKSFETPSGSFIPYDLISGKWIRTMGNNYNKIHQKRTDALDFAFQAYEKLNMRIYDAMPEHGGLEFFEDASRVINRDIQHDKGSIFFVDYYQLFADSEEYKDVSKVARQFQDLARQKNITLVVLAQRNEEAIKGRSGYSAGIKGGGTASATADYVFLTNYKEQEESNDRFLSVEIKHAREDASGEDMKKNLEIHPQSGLVYDFEWWKSI